MKYKCEMVRDLMPLCIDEVASESSKKVVIEHIAECKECVEYYDKLNREIPLDEGHSQESRTYVEIAKKIRKRKIVTRLTIIFAIFIVFELLVNYAGGYRYTPQSAADLSGRLNASSTLIGNYDWGKWRFYIYDSANSYDVVTVQQHWNGWKTDDNYLVWPKYPMDKGGIINAGDEYFWTDTDKKYGIQLFPIIVEDSRVARVKVSVFGKEKSVKVENNKLIILTFENKDDKLTNDATGMAYDSAGNVIYKLADDNANMRWVWEKQ